MNLFLDYFTPAISTAYVDVDYGGLHLFRQSDKGMCFALKYVTHWAYSISLVQLMAMHTQCHYWA